MAGSSSACVGGSLGLKRSLVTQVVMEKSRFIKAEFIRLSFGFWLLFFLQDIIPALVKTGLNLAEKCTFCLGNPVCTSQSGATAVMAARLLPATTRIHL